MSLITTIAELKKFVVVDDNTSIKTFAAFIEDAEQLYVKKLLGTAFFDQLVEDYTTAAGNTLTLSALKQQALARTQKVVALYAFTLSINKISVSVGELGVRVHRSEDSDQASRWQVEKLQREALQSADTHADELLFWLEANASASNDLALWHNSTANTYMSGRIVYSTAIASKHIRINNSRRVFLALKDQINTLEERYVPKFVGSEQYAELVTQLKERSVTAQNQKLIDRLEPIVAKRALYMQLQFMRVQINESGLFIYSGVDDLTKLGQLATDADIKVLKAQLADTDMGYPADEQELKQFVIDNIADYPLIAASKVYKIQPDPGPLFYPQNSIDNKHFIV